jgi:hypothetical protein
MEQPATADDIFADVARLDHWFRQIRSGAVDVAEAPADVRDAFRDIDDLRRGGNAVKGLDTLERRVSKIEHGPFRQGWATAAGGVAQPNLFARLAQLDAAARGEPELTQEELRQRILDVSARMGPSAAPEPPAQLHRRLEELRAAAEAAAAPPTLAQDGPATAEASPGPPAAAEAAPPPSWTLPGPALPAPPPMVAVPELCGYCLLFGKPSCPGCAAKLKGGAS